MNEKGIKFVTRSFFNKPQTNEADVRAMAGLHTALKMENCSRKLAHFPENRRLTGCKKRKKIAVEVFSGTQDHRFDYPFASRESFDSS